MKKIVIAVVMFVATLVFIPMSFQVIYQAKTPDEMLESKLVETTKPQNEAQVPAEEAEEKVVTVFRESKNEYIELPIETYLVGVVSGEMPALYDLEALKAQAVAARTYTMQLLEAESAIYDTVKHQVYLDNDQLKEKWQDKFDEYYAKVSQAVNETAGQVITYDNELIKPFYFSISNGYTENSEDYWSKEYPYLKSVNSEWDKEAPNYEVQTEFTLTDLRTKFSNSSLTKESFIILNETEGQNVNEILVGDKVYSGREFREILSLRSADFSLDFQDNKVVITTYGYGHGVGMSQFGANALAKQGKTYDEIIKHYYQNVNITENIY